MTILLVSIGWIKQRWVSTGQLKSQSQKIPCGNNIDHVIKKWINNKNNRDHFSQQVPLFQVSTFNSIVWPLVKKFRILKIKFNHVCYYIQVKRIYVPLPDENVRRLLLKNQLKGRAFKLPGKSNSVGTFSFYFIETFYRFMSWPNFSQPYSLLDWIIASCQSLYLEHSNL